MFVSLTTARSFLPTHQPISREKQTQIPNICQILSQIVFSPYFLISANLTLSTLPTACFLISQYTHLLQLSAKRAQDGLYPSET